MRKLVQGALMVALLMGCAGKEPLDTGPSGDTGASSPDGVACAARSDPGVQMVPGDTPNTTAPAILELSTPYTMQLTPTRGGWVRLELPDAGNYILHTGFAGVVQGLWNDSGEVTISAARPSAVCADEIPAVYSFSTSGPETLYLQMGPLASLTFWVFLEAEST